MVTASKQMEVIMKLVTRFELAKRSDNELYSMLRKTFNELANSNQDTPDRRNTLASIENIRREINSRAVSP